LEETLLLFADEPKELPSEDNVDAEPTEISRRIALPTLPKPLLRPLKDWPNCLFFSESGTIGEVGLPPRLIPSSVGSPPSIGNSRIRLGVLGTGGLRRVPLIVAVLRSGRVTVEVEVSALFDLAYGASRGYAKVIGVFGDEGFKLTIDPRG